MVELMQCITITTMTYVFSFRIKEKKLSAFSIFAVVSYKTRVLHGEKTTSSSGHFQHNGKKKTSFHV